jgi:AcrR family transcriptional regulator
VLADRAPSAMGSDGASKPPSRPRSDVRRHHRGADARAVAELQRERILDAMVAVSSELGAANVTAAAVVRHAGVSRRTFYEAFENTHACFLAALDRSLAQTEERVLPVYRAHARWADRIRAALTELLGMFDEDRRLARFLLLEFQRSDASVLERRQVTLDRLVDAVDAGRRESKPAAEHVSRLVAEGVVGAVVSVLQARIAAPARHALLELRNELMSLTVLPYMGRAAARRELDRLSPEPAPGQDGAKLAADPFRSAGVRLTYRTMRVLGALADHPGASNRLIGERAEIRDQGQISKLLSRLRRAGMIANTGLPLAKGAANSWELTDNGRQVVAAFRVKSKAHAETVKQRT